VCVCVCVCVCVVWQELRVSQLHKPHVFLRLWRQAHVHSSVRIQFHLTECVNESGLQERTSW